MEIIRSATFEGMADKAGFPGPRYQSLYAELAANQVKTMITGFMYIAPAGRAMHPGQAGMDSLDKARAFQSVTAAVHRHGARIIAQIAHTGRQTVNTGYETVGVSNKPSAYFQVRPRRLTTGEIYGIIEQFADSARYAMEAGFDGVQLHAAHGYLIHQFLLRSVNDRQDEFAEGTRFLTLIIQRIRERCGSFPIWVKVSGGVDIEDGTDGQFVSLIQALDTVRPEAIEVSYGTMDYALNIFRGQVPLRAVLRHNPIYREKDLLWKAFVLPRLRLKVKRFTPMYNLDYAKLAKQHTDIPIAVVGGFREGRNILSCGMDYVSLCRPFIREPDFLLKLADDAGYRSACTNCNLCAIMCDTDHPLACYGGR